MSSDAGRQESSASLRAAPVVGAAVSDLPRTVGFWGALAVMVGVMIGSGIFRTPTSIAANLGDPWLILLLWVVGGLISLCGALTFAELAAMMPRSGGIYVFLREAFGPCPAFIFGWTYMLIAKPAAAGGIAIIFSEHLNTLLGVEWNAPLITCAALFALTVVNVLGMRGSARLAIALTALKYAAVAIVVVLGGLAALREILLPAADAGRSLAAAHFAEVPSPRPFIDAVLPVMAAIMWTYDGWADVGAIAGEVREPGRTLPRVFLAGTLAVTALYVLANAVYLWHIPLPEMRATPTVAPLLLQRLAGPLGATAVTAIIILSTLGSSHASVMTGARVTFAQARDRLLFRFLGSIHPRWRTPAASLWVQLALSCAAVLALGEFSALADSFVFTMWIFYGMGAVALFVMRFRRPQAPRPFRVPGYPWVPAIFVVVSAAMTVLAIRDDPLRTGLWLGVLAAGAPAYLLWRACTRRNAGSGDPHGVAMP